MGKTQHPESHNVKAKCVSCEAEYDVMTTSKSLSVDVCANCHPFYKGTTTSAKSTGRVERFKKMLEQSKKGK